MDTRRMTSKQYVVHFPWTGVTETDNETMKAAAQVIASLHSGANLSVPDGGGWKIEQLWSVKRLAWMCFAGIVIHGWLILYGLACLADSLAPPTP